jgi:hypothetical protein
MPNVAKYLPRTTSQPSETANRDKEFNKNFRSLAELPGAKRRVPEILVVNYLSNELVNEGEEISEGKVLAERFNCGS